MAIVEWWHSINSNAFGARQVPDRFKQYGVAVSMANWRKEVPSICIQILIMLFSPDEERNKVYLQPTSSQLATSALHR